MMKYTLVRYFFAVSALLWAGACQKTVEPAVLVAKVACIGTSITEGFVLPVEQTYPYLLQGLEMGDAKVLNYGVGGTSMLKKGDSPYWSAAKYKYATDWKPTIVVIEFGTNDSKAQNWKYKSEFKSDYLAMIDSFRKLSSAPKIYLCIPTPAFSENYDIQPDVVKNEIVPLVYAIAKEANLETINLYDLMLTKPELFPDGIHPNAEGAKLLAAEVYKVIKKK